jgi:hypothetical protein
MLFVAYKEGSTRTHRVDNAVTCAMARNMVADWVGVEAEQVFLWWSASMIEDAFPQEARFLFDDDQTLYEHGAIYFGITNDLGDQNNLALASLPCLARFVRFGGAGFGPPPVFRIYSSFPHRLRVGSQTFSWGGVLEVDTSAQLRVNALTSAQLRDDALESTQVQEDYHDMPELVQDSDDDLETID